MLALLDSHMKRLTKKRLGRVKHVSVWKEKINKDDDHLGMSKTYDVTRVQDKSLREVNENLDYF